MIIMLLLFFAGITLILAEFLMPGMIIGIIGAGLLIASAGYGIATFPDYAAFIIISEVVGVVITIMAGMYMLTSTRFPNPIVLTAKQDLSAGWTAPGIDADIIGLQGTVHSALRPAGAIMIGDQRYDAVSSGAFIAEGASVTVIEVEGIRVVVEETDQQAHGA